VDLGTALVGLFALLVGSAGVLGFISGVREFTQFARLRREITDVAAARDALAQGSQSRARLDAWIDNRASTLVEILESRDAAEKSGGVGGLLAQRGDSILRIVLGALVILVASLTASRVVGLRAATGELPIGFFLVLAAAAALAFLISKVNKWVENRSPEQRRRMHQQTLLRSRRLSQLFATEYEHNRRHSSW
jgi:predicted PurR-regulated permease PerM